jgi:hypothetical protein
MKVVPSALCGLLLVLPAGSAFAQSSATTSKTPAAQSGTTTQSGAGAQSGTAAKSPAAQGAPPPAGGAGISTLDPNAPPPPAHPLTTEQTKELLDLMGYKKMEDRNWSQMITMNRQAAPFIPEDVWTDVQSGINGIDYTTMMQPIYAKYLSQEDADKAIAFYRTPAGQRVLQSMPSILGESVAASQQKGRQVGRDAIEKHRPEIEAAQKKYQEEHAPAGGAGAPGAGPAGAGSSGAGTSGSGATSTSPSKPSTGPGTTSGSGAGSTTQKPPQK